MDHVLDIQQLSGLLKNRSPRSGAELRAIPEGLPAWPKLPSSATSSKQMQRSASANFGVGVSRFGIAGNPVLL
jgi:hypothetical protein